MVLMENVPPFFGLGATLGGCVAEAEEYWFLLVLLSHLREGDAS